jgi:hypothetical protein
MTTGLRIVAGPQTRALVRRVASAALNRRSSRKGERDLAGVDQLMGTCLALNSPLTSMLVN